MKLRNGKHVLNHNVKKISLPSSKILKKIVNRDAPLKGWKERAPKKGAERQNLYDTCGPISFLLPDKKNPSLSKFPVIAKKGECVLDCGGTKAAYIRARQHKYDIVAKKAKMILDNLCQKDKK